MNIGGQKLSGVRSIIDKLVEWGGPTYIRRTVSVDVQPSFPGDASIFVFVTGTISMIGVVPIRFSEVFCLLPQTNAGNLYVYLF